MAKKGSEKKAQDKPSKKAQAQDKPSKKKSKVKSEDYYVEMYGPNGSHETAKKSPIIPGTLRMLRKEQVDDLLGTNRGDGNKFKKEDIEELHKIFKTPGHDKQICFRTCEATGEAFPVATSDLHQTTMVRSEREKRQKEQQKERRKRRRQEAKAENEALKARVAELEKSAQASK